MQEHAILLHGVWMRSVTLLVLARRLREDGFSAEVIDYASVFGDLDRAFDRVRARMQASAAARVHLVGHSLGGLVAIESVRGRTDLPPGAIVCLGSPLKGSAVARVFARHRGARWLLGQSRETLEAGVAAWDGSRPLGVIAGRLPIGIGVPLGALPAPNDGMVAVAETELAGVSDHRTVRASHTGLVFSTRAAELTAAFLRSGRFPGRPG